MIVEKMSSKDWIDCMDSMYASVFDDVRPLSLERCDFVLIAKDNELDPVGFITCHEMDSETIYWQFGGALKKVKNSIHVMSHYVHFITWCTGKYKRITTRIENDNLPMLKMALKCGFLIQGVWNMKNKIYVEQCFEAGG